MSSDDAAPPCPKRPRLDPPPQSQRSVEEQRRSWDALDSRITDLVRSATAQNIHQSLSDLLSLDLRRGRGLFCRAVVDRQAARPGDSAVLAALVAGVNRRRPEAGRLLLARVVLRLRDALARGDRAPMLSSAKFVAHLLNQSVAEDLLAVNVLAATLYCPTDDRVEAAAAFLRECGAALHAVCPRAFEMMDAVLGVVGGRVRRVVEELFEVWKAKEELHGVMSAVPPELDVVRHGFDRRAHMIDMYDDSDLDPQNSLDVFQPSSDDGLQEPVDDDDEEEEESSHEDVEMEDVSDEDYECDEDADDEEEYM